MTCLLTVLSRQRAAHNRILKLRETLTKHGASSPLNAIVVECLGEIYADCRRADSELKTLITGRGE